MNKQKYVRVDNEAHEILRQVSFESKKHMSEIVSELIKKHLSKENQKKSFDENK